jgi:hypothetical protein
MIRTRVARFFWLRDTKTEKNVIKEHKMYQMVITYVSQMSVKYFKWP